MISIFDKKIVDIATNVRKPDSNTIIITTKQPSAEFKYVRFAEGFTIKIKVTVNDQIYHFDTTNKQSKEFWEHAEDKAFDIKQYKQVNKKDRIETVMLLIQNK